MQWWVARQINLSRSLLRTARPGHQNDKRTTIDEPGFLAGFLIIILLLTAILLLGKDKIKLMISIKSGNGNPGV